MVDAFLKIDTSQIESIYHEMKNNQENLRAQLATINTSLEFLASIDDKLAAWQKIISELEAKTSEIKRQEALLKNVQHGVNELAAIIQRYEKKATGKYLEHIETCSYCTKRKTQMLEHFGRSTQ